MGIVVVLLLLLAVGVPVAAVILVFVASRSAPEPSEAAAAARRHALGINLAAWTTLVVLPWLVLLIATPVFTATAGIGAYSGVVSALWPGLGGLLFLAVHAVGELTWPRPTGTVRRAHLSPRATPRGPRWLWRLTWTWAGLLLVTLVAAGITSSDGRTLTVSYAANAVQSTGPYPGWRYGVPLLISAALLLAATEGVLRLIARRPAVVDADPVYDAASRRLSAHRTVRGTQLVLAITEAAVLAVMGKALSNLDRVPVGAGLGVLAATVGLVGLVAVVIPAQPAAQAEPRSLSTSPPTATGSAPAAGTATGTATTAEPTPMSHPQP